MKQIDHFNQQYPTCSTIRRENLIPRTLPQRPWEQFGSDLFELNKAHYLLVIDYFSRYIELAKLSTTTLANIIQALKSIFSRHGIPGTLISDNGPQYSAKEFESFTKAYGFTHITSSPYHQQENGELEKAVKTVKKLLKSSKDPHLALFSYQTTPLPWCNQSPAQFLMGRNICANHGQIYHYFINKTLVTKE